MNHHITHPNSITPTGKVVLLGAGPGAADLITVRGLRFLQQADCVLYDALAGTELLAECKPRAVLIPVGKRCGKRSTAQMFINKQLVDNAQKYPLVVRLKGGDPMVFGRADEEMQALRNANIAFEVVPGITAALAAASSLQTSLTLRGLARSVTLATPATAAEHMPYTPSYSGNPNDTLAVYMGLKQAQQWALQLMQHGLPGSTPVVVCHAVSTPHEQFIHSSVTALAHNSHALQHLEGPCVILIGPAMQQYMFSETSQTQLASK